MTLIDNLDRTIRWVQDLRDGEVIETHDWRKDRLNFQEPVSPAHLDQIITILNKALELDGEPLRVTHRFGALFAVWTNLGWKPTESMRVG